jgi:hypothetical protein
VPIAQARETSRDLRTWTVFKDQVDSPAELEIVDSANASADRLFYRVRVERTQSPSIVEQILLRTRQQVLGAAR